MPTQYKVNVYAEKFTTVTVTAENETEAKEKAQSECLYGYRQWSDSKTITGAKIVSSGPVGEPLIKMPEEWEIYNLDENAKIGKTANAKITAAVRMACADILAKHKANEDVGPKYVAKLFEKYVGPVFKKYSKLGTYDGEPRRAVAHILAKYAAWTGADYDDVYDAI